MQITAELDNQHLEKLQQLESRLKKTTSELLSLAIDEIYRQQTTEESDKAQRAYQIMLQSGFIGSIEGDGNLSENYKEELDWSHKL